MPSNTGTSNTSGSTASNTPGTNTPSAASTRTPGAADPSTVGSGTPGAADPSTPGTSTPGTASANNDHYFSAVPSSEARERDITVTLMDREFSLTTASGVFSPDRVDVGTGVLLRGVPTPTPDGHLLDLGCGWGPLALTLALSSPHATVWAVDVNERALDLVNRNTRRCGLSNVRAVTPEEVPDDVAFTTIWSNPPIRVGKEALHELLLRWLPRLETGAEAWLVVARKLGADSLQRWLDHELPASFHTARADTSKGFRLLHVRHDPQP